MESTESARELIRRGMACARDKRPEAAIVRFALALVLVDPERDPRLALSACHNLAQVLAQLGLPKLAKSLVALARPLYRRANDPLMNARLIWLKGHIATASCRYEEATRKFLQAMAAMAALGRMADVAELGKDLALVQPANLKD